MRLLDYLLALSLRWSHKDAVHYAYHQKEEVVTMTFFGLNPKDHNWYLAVYRVTCPTCSHSRVMQRIWPVHTLGFSSGYTYSQAREEAQKPCSVHS